MKILIVPLLITLFLILMSGYAFACSVSTTAVSFGNYISNQASPLDGTGSVTVNCADGTPYSIELNDGTNFTGYLNRRMANGGNYLSYSFYKDSGRTLAWGTGVDAVAGTGTGTDQGYTVYGRIPANQNVSLGAYSDTVTATVTW